MTPESMMPNMPQKEPPSASEKTEAEKIKFNYPDGTIGSAASPKDVADLLERWREGQK